MAGACLLIALVMLPGCERVKDEAPADCLIDEGPCVKTITDEKMSVQFNIEPKPVRAMEKLEFSVRITREEKPIRQRKVVLDLSMPGMYMGKNRPELVFAGDGTWKGAGVLPICPAGRTVWKAEVLFPDESNGKARIASERFVFKVGK